MAVSVYRLTSALDSQRAVGLEVGLLGAKLPERPPPGFPCEELAREFS